MFTAAWGAWIAFPLWDVFSRAPLYSRMNEFMPEWGWGTVAMASGLAIIWGALHPSRAGLIWGTVVAVMHWTQVGVLYIAGDWQNTGGLVSLSIAGFIALMWRAWDRTQRAERRRATPRR